MDLSIINQEPKPKDNKESNLVTIKIMTAYALWKIEKEINNKMSIDKINQISRTIMNITFMNMKEQQHYLSKWYKIPYTTRKYIKEYVKSKIGNIEYLRENNLNELMGKMKRKEIDKEEVRRIYKAIKNDEIEYDDNNRIYNYYNSKKIIDEIVKTLDEEEVTLRSMNDIKNELTYIIQTIKYYINQARVKSPIQTLDERLTKKLDKLKSHMQLSNIHKLRVLLNLKTSDKLKIIAKTKKKIMELQAIMKLRNDEKKFERLDFSRRRVNFNMIRYSKRSKEYERETNKDYPTKENTLAFWNKIYNNDKCKLNTDNPVIKELTESYTNNYKRAECTMEELEMAIKNLGNWKAPGIDGIQGFFYKYITKIRQPLLTIYNEYLRKGEIEENEMEGITILLYKGGDRKEAANYRPITCINVSLRIFTSIISNKLRRLVISESYIIENNQLGCMKNTLASKEGLLYSMSLQNTLDISKMRYMCSYYDIKKAYDSVNHDLIIYKLNQMNVELNIIDTIKYMMSKWSITMRYTNEEEVGNIKLYNGILQGDSLSPLLFILSINVLSKELNKEISKIRINNKEYKNHLFYMDDLKITTTTKEDMEKAHRIVMNTFEDIGFEVNTKKCGLLIRGFREIPEGMEEIPIVAEETPYKYLGLEMTNVVSEEIYKKRIKNIIYKRADEILKKNLNPINTFRMIWSNCGSVFNYGCSIVNYGICELEEINTKIRNKIRQAGLYNKLCLKDRLYLPLSELGYGLFNFRMEYGKELIRTILKLKYNGSDEIIELQKVIEGKNKSKTYYNRFLKVMKKVITNGEMKQIMEESKDPDEAMKKVNEKINEYYIKEWKKKKNGALRKWMDSLSTESKYLKSVWRRLNIRTTPWISIIKMQDNAFITGKRKAIITREANNKYCKYCHVEATINHILHSCPINKKVQMETHDMVCLEIYNSLLIKYDLREEWYAINDPPKCITNDEKNINIL